MRIPALISVLMLVGCAPPLVDQDVSFLVPLEQSRSFLPASGVPGISRGLFDRLHALTVVDEPDALYGALSTVAVRLDACFREGVAEAPCRPQVRLVLQPVFDSADGVTTRDAAIHVFFSVTEVEVVGAVKELALLRARLGVSVPAGLAAAHPGFSKSAWVDGARKILTPLLRADHVVRATAMSVHASNQAWIFSGVEVAGEERTSIVIPTLSPLLEGHVTSTGGRDSLTVSLDPAPVAEPTLPTILKGDVRRQASAAELSAAVAALNRLEDPASHNPGTVDCGTCHVQSTAKWFLLHDAPGSGADTSVLPSDTYSDSRALRAFGYFFTAPAISPRVQRETMAVRADFALRLDP